jgi:uncharacterized membrane protein YdjX (TVP38/TMEM64 family)
VAPLKASPPDARAGEPEPPEAPGMGSPAIGPPALEPPPQPAGRLPRRALVRFGLLILLVVAAALLARYTPLGAYLTKDKLLDVLGHLQQAWWSPLLLIALYVGLSPLGLPATPLMVAGSFVFGPLWGTVYNLLGTLGGALSSYLFARHMGHELVQHLGGSRLKRIERRLSRHGFAYLVGVRFFPLPFPAVNFAMALAGIRPLPFLVSTAIGLAPSIAIWTYFYSALFQAAAGERAALIQKIVVAMFLLGFVSLLPGLIRRRLRRRKYRQIMAARRGRVTKPTVS